MEIKPKQHLIRKHNHSRNDPFFWLHKKNMNLIKKINKHTEQSLCDTTDLQTQIYDEIKNRIFEDDKTLTSRYHQYYYYTQIKHNENYPKYYLLKSKSAKSQCYLDFERLSKKHSHFEIGMVRVSHDETFVLYSVDYTGDLKYTLYMKSLLSTKSKQVVDFHIANDYVIHPNNESIYFIKSNNIKRKNKVYTLNLVTHKKTMIYEETKEEYSLSLSLSTDKKHIFLYSSKYETDNVYLIEDLKITPLFTQKSKTEYKIDHFNDKYYLLTNKDNKINFELYESDTLSHWKCIHKHSQKIYIESFSIFYDSIFLHLRDNGFPKLLRINLTNYHQRFIQFPLDFYSYSLISNLNPYYHLLNLSYTSYATPRIRYQYNLKTDTLKTIDTKKIKNYHPNNYVEGYFKIGKIIATYFYHKDKIKLDGKQSYPCYLYGYSSYGMIDEPSFDSEYVSLVDRGYLYVVPNLRGSNFYGPKWYLDGKMLKKKNTFLDFQNVAEYLIKKNYTSSKQLVIEGGSAGGLLVGACINMNPSLYNVAILRVPFVDCVTTLLDQKIPLTLTEYGEWGNPNKYKTHYDYILSYSPYDNIDLEKEYPHIYIETGLNDSQVQFYEPLKYYAKLTKNDYFKENTKSLLLDIKVDSGHAGTSKRYQRINDEAKIISFIIKHTNPKI